MTSWKRYGSVKCKYVKRYGCDARRRRGVKMRNAERPQKKAVRRALKYVEE